MSSGPPRPRTIHLEMQDAGLGDLLRAKAAKEGRHLGSIARELLVRWLGSGTNTAPKHLTEEARPKVVEKIVERVVEKRVEVVVEKIVVKTVKVRTPETKIKIVEKERLVPVDRYIHLLPPGEALSAMYEEASKVRDETDGPGAGLAGLWAVAEHEALREAIWAYRAVIARYAEKAKKF